MDLVDVLLEVLERDASDLHLTVGSPPIIRINGVLVTIDPTTGKATAIERVARTWHE